MILMPGINYVSSSGKPVASGRFENAMAELLCALCAKGAMPATLDPSPTSRVGAAAPLNLLPFVLCKCCIEMSAARTSACSGAARPCK